MGNRTPGEPLFGSKIETQPIPLTGGQSRIADLDGDGLDEIVAYSTRDVESPLVVLENLGRLPGTRGQFRPTN